MKARAQLAAGICGLLLVPHVAAAASLIRHQKSVVEWREANQWHHQSTTEFWYSYPFTYIETDESDRHLTIEKPNSDDYRIYTPVKPGSHVIVCINKEPDNAPGPVELTFDQSVLDTLLYSPYLSARKRALRWLVASDNWKAVSSASNDPDTLFYEQKFEAEESKDDIRNRYLLKKDSLLLLRKEWVWTTPEGETLLDYREIHTANDAFRANAKEFFDPERLGLTDECALAPHPMETYNRAFWQKVEPDESGWKIVCTLDGQVVDPEDPQFSEQEIRRVNLSVPRSISDY